MGPNISVGGGLTSSCAVMLQLVAVHRLLGVCPFPGGERQDERPYYCSCFSVCSENDVAEIESAAKGYQRQMKFMKMS